MNKSSDNILNNKNINYIVINNSKTNNLTKNNLIINNKEIINLTINNIIINIIIDITTNITLDFINKILIHDISEIISNRVFINKTIMLNIVIIRNVFIYPVS